MTVVKQAMKKGMVVVTSGSTNGYLVEELLAKKIDKTGYMTGKTLPASVSEKDLIKGEAIGDIIFKNGKLTDEYNRQTAAENLQQDDVFIKGANALNYQQGVAGICIGHPAGGTVGGALGHIIGKRAHLLIPVGLEKCTGTDIYQMAELANQGSDEFDSVPRLWPVKGIIVTEIEALQTLFPVKAYHLASGGLAGAEGAVRLIVEGEPEIISSLKDFIAEIQGEPPFYSLKN